jgi:hypothetical protein
MVCAVCAIPSRLKVIVVLPRLTAGIEQLNDPVEMELNEAPTEASATTYKIPQQSI